MLDQLTLFQKTYDFLIFLKPTIQRFAKVHKYSLGIQLENGVLDLLKKIIRANLKKENKAEFIEECMVSYETLRILIRVAKNFNVLNLRQYELAAQKLEEIGRLLGGWYKKFS